jgi:hypothetical protein
VATQKLFGVEFFPGRVSPVGWAAFPAGKGITEQGLSSGSVITYFGKNNMLCVSLERENYFVKE